MLTKKAPEGNCTLDLLLSLALLYEADAIATMLQGRYVVKKEKVLKGF